MTRTDPPDILVSTAYRDIKVAPASTHSKPFHPSKQCDSWYPSTLEDNQERINKRHCRSFDFESLGDPKSRTSSMEYPHWRTERRVANPDVTWNTLGQQGHLRFSSPDLFNNRMPTQHASADVASEAARSELKRRARSKSAPRVKTTFTPVPFEESPPSVRRGREVSRAPRDPPRRPEASPRRESPYAATRPLMNEVHPIKLQPQRGEASRYSPLYVPDYVDRSRVEKPATSPHVRCRVDIKPDAAVLQQTARKPPMQRADVPWQRYNSGGSRSLTVPRQIPTSRTPTPSDCYSSEYRQPYQYSSSMPNSYIQPVEIPLQRMPSPREYYGRERRAFSSPNVLTKFFYADEPMSYSSPAPHARTYYQEDHYSTPSHTLSPKVQYMQDPRTGIVHTAPTRSYFTEIDPYPYPLQAMYPTSYSASEPGPYIIQTPPTRTYYGEDPRTYSIQTVSPKIFYAREPFTPPPEHHIPARAYHTEGRRRPRVSQPQVDDWYGSEVSGYSTHYPSSQVSQFTPQRVRREPALTPWYANPCIEPTRLGTDAGKPYSKSWDNILNPQVEREQPVHRGHSHDNLLYPGKRAVSPDDRRQPVVVNLSRSPRRYAALSLSDNSLLDKSPTDSGKPGVGKPWFVTPEITITDNDIHQGGTSGKTEVRSASWNVLDSESTPAPTATHQEPPSDSAESKDKTHHSSSLQQSLEQLDELLADLVIDYKPPASRRPSEDLLDQLKKLINEDEAGPSAKKPPKEPENPGPLSKQPTSTKMIPGIHRDADSGCDGLQKTAEECSPDESTDEDDTMMCSNRKCQRTETLFNACLYFKSCHSCYTYYCSRNCRREDWDVHKESCLYGRIGSICRHVIKFCRETMEVHKAFSRIAKVGYLSRGRGVLFLGFPSPGSSKNFLQYGLESLLMSPTYLSLRELDGFKENLGEYCKELQEAGNEYDPSECFLLNVSIAVGDQVPDRPSPRVQAPTVRKHAKVSLASYSPERKVQRKESDMETLILTPPPGTADIDKEGEEGRKAREICFINIQRELRIRGVFLRHEYPQIYQQLCHFVESNERFTPTTIYPIDKRTGKQFMCMIMAASEPRTLDWVGTPNLLDDII
ncbi:apical junction component 1 homolog [Megalops cyprinoides]|uniref:apical junction component 1 homolog n=1 Tax=Megalops cyprinoides TaxID=118141 RepID=UPI001863A02F|nr:apical junction component 1 homolog [Megalops cyprinoides]XP_036385226.1 apical junction component 1 homolog [Megalops cyprinoides]